MKNHIVCLFFFLIPFMGIAQPMLTKSYNMFRVNDKLVKQQVSYKSPGRSGTNVLWDFGKVDVENEKYTLLYFGKVNSIVTGIEHKTLYDYFLKGDTLLCTGYKNSTTLMDYVRPELQLVFPVSFQNRGSDYFYGTGEYCGKIRLQVQGFVSYDADSYGMLILPSKDTINNALRIHYRKLLSEEMTPGVRRKGRDSCRVFMDSIDFHLANDSLRMQLDTYRWYADGYRYPLFEIIESRSMKYGKVVEHFKTAFFYSPLEQSYELQDSENYMKREEGKNKIESQQGEKVNRSGWRGIDSGDILFLYNVVLDENTSNLSVEYYLETDAEISISLYDLQGRMLVRCPSLRQSKGNYLEKFALADYPQGIYLLRLTVNKQNFGEKIVK